MNKKKITAAFALGVSVFLGVTAFVFWNPLQTIQWKISDMFFRARPVSDAITIIAIDEKSLSPEASLGRFKDWPRSYYAGLLDKINNHKPAVIAIDLDFRQGSRGLGELSLKELLRNSYETQGFDIYAALKQFDSSSHPDDANFQKALAASGPVVLASQLTSTEKPKEGDIAKVAGVISPIFKTEGNASQGYVNMPLDRDGVARRFIPQRESYKSFPLAIIETYGQKKASFGKDRTQPISYTARPFSYRTISFADALAGRYNPSDITGKIVLVGATAAVLQDAKPTPTSRINMPGVEILANITQQLLEGRLTSEQSIWSILLFIGLLAFGGSFLFLFLRLLPVGIIFGIILIAIPAIAFASYGRGLIMNVPYPLIAWTLTIIASLGYRNQTEFREKRQIQKAFAHYVSPVVVNELVKNPAMLKLGGMRENITVMFSDIVGFTGIAEQLSPEDTVALLNDYLTAMTEVIFGYHGTLDKYQGDAIMALFGAPLADPHHAVNACQTALGMRKALVALHEKWNAIPQLPFKDELIGLDFRVGIATGPAVVGNVGSEKRFDYTAIGDIVNLGSRLESINRKYATRVIVDKETFTAVTENHNPFIFRKLDTVRVKGKKHETEIFELIALSETVTNETRAMLDDFENGRILYTQRNFKEAKQYFESAITKFPDDGPSRIYLNRCDFFIRKPPNRDWDAIVDLEEK